jgi:hypothetical protein
VGGVMATLVAVDFKESNCSTNVSLLVINTVNKWDSTYEQRIVRTVHHGVMVTMLIQVCQDMLKKSIKFGLLKEKQGVVPNLKLTSVK